MKPKIRAIKRRHRRRALRLRGGHLRLEIAVVRPKATGQVDGLARHVQRLQRSAFCATSMTVDMGDLS